MLKEYGIRYIFNVPYSPDLNPVESCISVMKNTIKRQRTANLVLGKYDSNEELIKKGMRALTKKKIQNCIKWSKHLIYEY